MPAPWLAVLLLLLLELCGQHQLISTALQMRIKQALKRRRALDIGLEQPQPAHPDLADPGEPVAIRGHCDDIASGASSVSRVMQRVRDHVAESGTACHPQTLALGKASGRNDPRDFWRFIDIPIEIETIKLPVKDEKTDRIAVETFPILHPHRVLAYIMTEVGVEFSSAEVAEYWRHSREFGEGWATSSQASSQHLPVGLHGDCARMASQNTFQKVFALSINLVLFRPASIRHSRFVIFTCPRHKTREEQDVKRPDESSALVVGSCIRWY